VVPVCARENVAPKIRQNRMAATTVRWMEAQDMDDSFERTYQFLVFMKIRLVEDVDFGMLSQT
jgi:hypothetical protein